MSEESESKNINIPQQIFNKFVTELETQKCPKEVVDSLKKICVANKSISIEALKKALFSSESVDI